MRKDGERIASNSKNPFYSKKKNSKNPPLPGLISSLNSQVVLLHGPLEMHSHSTDAARRGCLLTRGNEERLRDAISSGDLTGDGMVKV